ncbi:MAG: hypothetical protein SFY32_11715 [Bacteroidota bacterium]|nr:hypothetical protein [Bacteroidota bacterium]
MELTTDEQLKMFTDLCIKAKEKRIAEGKEYQLNGTVHDSYVRLKPMFRKIARKYLWCEKNELGEFRFAKEEVFNILGNSDLIINDVLGKKYWF